MTRKLADEHLVEKLKGLKEDESAAEQQIEVYATKVSKIINERTPHTRAELDKELDGLKRSIKSLDDTRTVIDRLKSKGI